MEEGGMGWKEGGRGDLINFTLASLLPLSPAAKEETLLHLIGSTLPHLICGSESRS